jgi:hypothetical protein
VLILGTIVMGATAGIALSLWFRRSWRCSSRRGDGHHDRRPEHPAAQDAGRGSQPGGGRVGGDDDALSIGFVLGGPAVAALGPRATYAIGGACGLLGAVVLVPVLRASRRTPVAEAIVEQEPIEADELVVTRVAG